LGRSRKVRFIIVTLFAVVPLTDGSTHAISQEFGAVPLHAERG